MRSARGKIVAGCVFRLSFVGVYFGGDSDCDCYGWQVGKCSISF